MKGKEVTIVVLALVLLGVSMLAASFEGEITGSTTKRLGSVEVNVINAVNNHPIKDAKLHVDDLEDGKVRLYYMDRTRRSGLGRFKINHGTYELRVTARDFVTHTEIINVRGGVLLVVDVGLFPVNYELKCSDGTSLDSCSRTRPLFCSNAGNLRSRCDLCACPQGLSCRFDGTCS